MAAPAGSTGTPRTSSRARRAAPALLAAALALTTAPPALAQTAPAPAPVAAQTPTVTIGISQASGVYTFRGTITPAVLGVRVSIARLGTDGTVTGMASSATHADGSYEILTSLPVGLASYYALTGATADLSPGRSRLYGVLVNVRPGTPATPTVTLDVRRGSSTYVFSGQVSPGRSVPVTLARLVGGRQVGVIGSRTGPGGMYAFSVPVSAGTHAFQVLTGAVDGLSAGRSRVYGLVVPPGR